MPIDGHPPRPVNSPLGLVVCACCRAGYHADCRGGVVTCECFLEVLLEAEEKP